MEPRQPSSHLHQASSAPICRSPAVLYGPVDRCGTADVLHRSEGRTRRPAEVALGTVARPDAFGALRKRWPPDG